MRLLVEITRHLTHNSGRALRPQQAGRAVILVGSVVDDADLIDVAGVGELCTTWADVDIALAIEGKIGPGHKPCRLRAVAAEDRDAC